MASVVLDAGFRCIASSEDTARSCQGELPTSSGPLPPDWNHGDDLYCLFYKHASSPGALFTVKSVIMDDMFLVSSVHRVVHLGHPSMRSLTRTRKHNRCMLHQTKLPMCTVSSCASATLFNLCPQQLAAHPWTQKRYAHLPCTMMTGAFAF